MATLSTTWTEQSVVSFTAGTLSTITSCISYVETKLKRGTLSSSTAPSTTEVQNELIYAKELMCEELGFTWQRRYVYATTVAASYRYAMPSDYNGGRVRLRDVTNDRRLTYVDPDRFDLKYPDPSEESDNKSDCYTIKNRELWLVPPSAGAYQLELEYPRSGDDTTQTDVSYIPQVMRFKMCQWAIYQSFLGLHMWNAAQLYKADWMEGMARSKRSDNRKRWSHTNQCLTWQQEYNAKFNQWS